MEVTTALSSIPDSPAAKTPPMSPAGPPKSPRQKTKARPRRDLPENLMSPTRFHPPEWRGDIEPECCIKVFRENRLVGVAEFDPAEKYMVFGRDPGTVSVFVGHRTVARQHAHIVFDLKGLAYVTDMETEHGTYVNDKKIPVNQPYELELDARITFGKCLRRYVFSVGKQRAFKELQEQCAKDSKAFHKNGPDSPVVVAESPSPSAASN